MSLRDQVSTLLATDASLKGEAIATELKKTKQDITPGEVHQAMLDAGVYAGDIDARAIQDTVPDEASKRRLRGEQ